MSEHSFTTTKNGALVQFTTQLTNATDTINIFVIHFFTRFFSLLYWLFIFVCPNSRLTDIVHQIPTILAQHNSAHPTLAYPSHVHRSWWRRGGRGGAADADDDGCIARSDGWCNGGTITIRRCSINNGCWCYCFGCLRRTGAVVADVRMESLVVGGVLDRLDTTVGQQNVVFASGHAVRIAVLRMAEVVSGVEVTDAIAECVVGGVLMGLCGG